MTIFDDEFIESSELWKLLKIADNMKLNYVSDGDEFDRMKLMKQDRSLRDVVELENRSLRAKERSRAKESS